MTRRWWAGYLAGGSVAIASYLLLPAGIARDVAYLAVGLSSVAALIVGIRRNRPARSAPWLLMAIGQLCWVCGDAVYSWYYDVVHQSPFPSVADVLYLAAYPLLGAGLAMLVRARRRERDLGGLIDSAVVTVGLGLMSWLFIGDPLLNGSEEPLLTRLISTAYPAADILLLAILVRLVTTPGARTTSFRLLVAASGLLVVADTVFSMVATSYDGGANDLLWLASYVLWGTAALHPSMTSLTEPAPEPATPLTSARLVSLTLAVLVAPASLGVQLAAGIPLDGWAFVVSSTVLFLLVVGRMRVAMQQTTASARHRDRLRDQLAHQASHDALTGLPNRAQVEALVEAALHRGQRAGTMIGLLSVDLDSFAAVNDAHGRPVGDQVLAEVARRMCELVRGGDTVGRLSGDEFAVLVEPLPQVEALVDLAERLLERLAVPMTVAGCEVTASVSIGVAVSVDGRTDAGGLLRDADVATGLAKASGRGRLEVFDDAVRRKLADRATLEAAIEHALRVGEFALHYQPVVDIDGAGVHGYEALIRWDRPGEGWCPPDAFIPTAELSDLIIDIDTWALQQATSQLARWRLADPVGCAALTVAVNVSGRHLSDPAIVTHVREALRRSGLPGDRLVLEITETVLLDAPVATQHLHELRVLGVAISIDDFGTGYTSIGQLQHLPVDTLKIDRSFIASDAPGAQALVALIISAAHAFGLTVVAEGVEHPEQRARLSAHGCDLAQGWWFGRPLPADAIVPGAAPARGETAVSADSLLGNSRRG